MFPTEEEELENIEYSLVGIVEDVLFILDGEPGNDDPMPDLDEQTYQTCLTKFAKDVFLFLKSHSGPDLDPAYRMELTSLLMWREFPTTPKERDQVLRGLANSLDMLACTEAYSVEERKENWWFYNDEGRDLLKSGYRFPIILIVDSYSNMKPDKAKSMKLTNRESFVLTLALAFAKGHTDDINGIYEVSGLDMDEMVRRYGEDCQDCIEESEIKALAVKLGHIIHDRD